LYANDPLGPEHVGCAIQGFAPKTESVVGGPAGLTGAGAVVAAVAELALDEVPAAATAAAVEPLVGVDGVLVEEVVAAAATVWANSRCASDDWVEGCRAACGLATARSAASIELIEET
jgi:hypothetical protein